MEKYINRRQFIQGSSAAVTGLVAAALLAKSTTEETVIASKSDTDIEKWLLHTGRHSISSDIHANVHQYLHPARF